MIVTEPQAVVGSSTNCEAVTHFRRPDPRGADPADVVVGRERPAMGTAHPGYWLPWDGSRPRKTTLLVLDMSNMGARGRPLSVHAVVSLLAIAPRYGLSRYHPLSSKVMGIGGEG